jgi:hypothetical protein
MPAMKIFASMIIKSCIQFLHRSLEMRMPARTVTLTLNQQQLELIDRTVAQGAASDRIALIKRAIREQGSKSQ